jgi:hypothetical protein
MRYESGEMADVALYFQMQGALDCLAVLGGKPIMTLSQEEARQKPTRGNERPEQTGRFTLPKESGK